MGQNVNIFVGDNGSGKSAVLAALAIGLGSKASSTSRSTSLKDFVRRGEASASIEIVLSNDGVDSFEKEKFGEEITVVRNITASGSSSYKLKNDKGAVVSTSRQDLNKMTLCLNIQVENPVLILNQDASRSFLKECDPKKLYALFLKATQIEYIIEKLNGCFSSASKCQTHYEGMTKSLSHLNKQVAEIKEKYLRLKSVENIREEIDQLENELSWLQVNGIEKELLACQKEISKKRAQFEELNDFIKNKKNLEDELKAKITELGVKFVEKQAALTEKTETYDVLKKNALQIQDRMSGYDRTFQKVQEKKKNIEKDIFQLETDIKEREDNPSNVDNQRRQNELKLNELNRKVVDLKSMLENSRRGKTFP